MVLRIDLAHQLLALAFLVPLSAGVTAVHLDPFEWGQAPLLLLERIATEGGTLTWTFRLSEPLAGGW